MKPVALRHQFPLLITLVIACVAVGAYACTSELTCGEGTQASGSQCVAASADAASNADATSVADAGPLGDASTTGDGGVWVESAADPIVKVRFVDPESGHEFSDYKFASGMYLQVGLAGTTRSGLRIALRPAKVDIASGTSAVVEWLVEPYVHTVAVGTSLAKASWTGIAGELSAVATINVLAPATALQFELSTFSSDPCTDRSGSDARYFPGTQDKNRIEARVPVGSPASVRGWASADQSNWFRIPDAKLVLSSSTVGAQLTGSSIIANAAGDVEVSAFYTEIARSAKSVVHAVPVAPAIRLGAVSTPVGPKVVSPESFALGNGARELFFTKEWRSADAFVLYSHHSGPGGAYAHCVSDAEKTVSLDPSHTTFELDTVQKRVRPSAAGTGLMWVEAFGFQTPILLAAYPTDNFGTSVSLSPVTAVRVKPSSVDVFKDSCQALTYEADIDGKSRALDAIDLAAANWSEDTNSLDLISCGFRSQGMNQICPATICQSQITTQTGTGRFWWLAASTLVPMTFRAAK